VLVLDYSTTEIEERLKTYKNIIFVRDPFERMLSAYRDKMFRNDHEFFRNMADHIKSKRTIETSKSNNVTFVEFVQYLKFNNTVNSNILKCKGNISIQCFELSNKIVLSYTWLT
jgi:hypothetical protein